MLSEFKLKSSYNQCQLIFDCCLLSGSNLFVLIIGAWIPQLSLSSRQLACVSKPLDFSSVYPCYSSLIRFLFSYLLPFGCNCYWQLFQFVDSATSPIRRTSCWWSIVDFLRQQRIASWSFALSGFYCFESTHRTPSSCHQQRQLWPTAGFYQFLLNWEGLTCAWRGLSSYW